MQARTRSVETVIVGAGQAGLVMSALLSEAGREHVLLDRRTALGGGWQDRWDAFRLVSPNWTLGVPGLPFDGPEPDGFMPRDGIIDWWRRYAATIQAPVELATDVSRLEAIDEQRSGDGRGGSRFRLTTTRGTIDARDVIVAGGPFQTPHLPAVSRQLDPSIQQLHSHDYRRPSDLAPGKVLLIGSGQTGIQLAEELLEAGREVLVSAGRCGPVPRTYRGKDCFWWFRELATRGREVGVTVPQVGELPSPAARFACNPQLSGHRGGHDVSLRTLAARGVRLLGRFEGADGTQARFAADLNQNVRFGDEFFEDRYRRRFDAFVERTGEHLPPDDRDQARPPEPAFDETTALGLRDEGVSTVIWTSGYRPAFSWVQLPILDEFGLPRQTGGRTDVPGLSFVGLPWLVDLGSANLIGLVRDAETLAGRI
jgi:putative flavoprotein involved in K+ transport